MATMPVNITKSITQCINTALTYLPLVPHICVGSLGHHWFRQWLVACSTPSHYVNQCWLIANWTPRNEFQWNHFHSKKCIRNCRLPKWRTFCPGRDDLFVTCKTNWLWYSHCYYQFNINNTEPMTKMNRSHNKFRYELGGLRWDFIWSKGNIQLFLCDIDIHIRKPPHISHAWFNVS